MIWEFSKIIIQGEAPFIFEKEINKWAFFTTSVTGLKNSSNRTRRRCHVHGGVINLLEGYGNDNPGANARVP